MKCIRRGKHFPIAMLLGRILLLFAACSLVSSKKIIDVIDESVHSGANDEQSRWMTLASEFQSYGFSEVSNRWASLTKSIEYYHKVLDIGNDFKFEANFRVAHLHAALGQLGDAIMAYDRAFEATKDLIDKSNVLVEKGKLLIGMGYLEEGNKLLHTALKFNSMNLNIYLPIVQSFKELNTSNNSDWSSLINRIEAAVEQQVRKKGILADLESGYISSNSISRDAYWALFEAYDTIDNPAQAWKYLEKAQKEISDKQQSMKKLKLQNPSPHDELNSDEVLLHHILNGSSFRSKDGRHPPSATTQPRSPIFLVSMPRSGVEAIGLMLCSHSEIFCDGEESTFSGAEYDILKSDIISAYVKDGTAASETLCDLFKKFKDNFFQRTYGQLGYKPYQSFRKYFLDTALKNYKNIHLISHIFPNAVIIHVVRDPMDTLLACFRYPHASSQNAWATTGAELLDEYLGYLKMMSYFKSLYPDRILEVSYEALVMNTNDVLASIMNYIANELSGVDVLGSEHIAYEKTMLYSFNSNAYLRVASELNRHPMGAWRKYATEISHILENILKKLSQFQSSRHFKLPFFKDINWKIVDNFDYTAYPIPGVVYPSKSKMQKSSVKKKKRRHVRTRFANFSSATNLNGELNSRIVGISTSNIDGKVRSRVVMKGEKRLNILRSLLNDGKLIKIEREHYPELVSRLHRPPWISSTAGQVKTTKESPLPLSKKKKLVMALHRKAVLRGPHPIVALQGMKSLLGTLKSQRSSSTTVYFDDLIASGFLYLTSNYRDNYLKSIYLLKNVLVLLLKEKGEVEISKCLVNAGIKISILQKSQTQKIQLLQYPDDANTLILELSDLLDASNFCISQGYYEEALQVISIALSRSLGGSGNKPSRRTLAVQTAVIHSASGSLDKAIRELDRIIQKYPTLLQAYVLKSNILIKKGMAEDAIKLLTLAMSRNATSDRYIEDHVRHIDLSKLNPSLINMVFGYLNYTSVKMIKKECTSMKIASRSDISSFLSFQSSFSMSDIASLLMKNRTNSLKQHYYLMNFASDNSIYSLDVAFFAAIAYYSIETEHYDAALESLYRLLELVPEDPDILLTVAGLQVAKLKFRKALDFYDHLIQGDSNHNLWYQREMLYLLIARIDSNFTHFNMFNDITSLHCVMAPNMYINASSCATSWNATALKNIRDYKWDFFDGVSLPLAAGASTNGFSFEYLRSSFTSSISEVFANIFAFSPFSVREKVSISFAALEIAQLLRRHVLERKKSGSSILIKDISSSALASVINDTADLRKYPSGQHPLSCVDIVDISLKWSQFVTPLEPVSLKTPRSAFDGPELIADDTFFTDFYSNKSFQVVKKLVITEFKKSSVELTRHQLESHLKLLQNAQDLAELLSLSSRDDIVVEFKLSLAGISTAHTSLPGCQLIPLVIDDTTYCFIPYTSDRAVLYWTELEFAFDRILAALMNSAPPNDVLGLALDFYYFWINFSPLRYRNRDVGYSVLSGIMLFTGSVINAIDDNLFWELEWEALLSESAGKFREVAVTYLIQAKPDPSVESLLLASSDDGHGDIQQTFNNPGLILTTLRKFSSITDLSVA